MSSVATLDCSTFAYLAGAGAGTWTGGVTALALGRGGAGTRGPAGGAATGGAA